LKAAGIIAAGWGERLNQKIPKALTPVGGRALIDYILDGFQAAGVEEVSCIVNEAARSVVDYVERSARPLKMDWIVQTTPSSLHSFLIVLERLCRWGQPNYLLSAVDSVSARAVCARFIDDAAQFSQADLVLGLTDLIDDEKPLRVAVRGHENTGLLPERVKDNPEAFEIIAMTTGGFDSEFVTSGFYQARPSILREKNKALSLGFTALRQYLGYLLKYGYRFYGVPLPPTVDVDRPQDIRAAEQLLKP